MSVGVEGRAVRMRQWAHWYARVRGWAIMPLYGVDDAGECACGRGKDCGSPGKHPVTDPIGLSQMTDETLEAAWGAGGGEGLAAACGSESALVGIHIQNGAGEESWRRLSEEWLSGDVGVESTLTVLTPTGGRIVLFATPRDMVIDANRLELDGYPGVSVLGDGAYVVLPPTGRWTWDHGGSPEDRLAPIPSGLLVRLSEDDGVLGRSVSSWVDADDPFLGLRGTRSLSDIGNGRRLVDVHGDIMSYTVGIGWRLWINHKWTSRLADEEVNERAKGIPPIIRSERRELETRLAGVGTGGTGEELTPAQQREITLLENRIDALRRWESSSRSMSRVVAAKKAAETDPRVLRAVDTWDRNPYLFGVANGVVDLRTGALQVVQRNMWIGLYSGLVYVPGAVKRKVCPEFWDFIDFITGGDEEYAHYLQVAAGYSLTGSMREKGIYFCPGPGNTGKTTFADMMRGVAGDYAQVIDSRLINLAERSGNIETSTLPLIGARIAVAADIPTVDFNADFMKKLSGGDMLTGRAMRQNQISFVSPAKLWIFSNHYPSIRDKQLMERIRVLPFTNVSTDRNRRRSEWTQRHTWTDGVNGAGGNAMMRAAMDWMIEGARIALRESEFPSCAVVEAAKARYEANGDVFWPYAEARCRREEGVSIDLATLYRDYLGWVSETNFMRNPPARPAFENILVERGIPVSSIDGERIVHGITVKPRPAGESVWDRAAWA